jgi:exosortase/archaeosortase family protein
LNFKQIVGVLKQNTVLFKFYLLFGYFCVLFYFFLHWKVSENYIAVNLPIFMANSVVFILNLFGVNAHSVYTQVQLPGFSFTIIYHCAGIFGMMIYAAAVIAYPARIIEKFFGIIVGFIGLYAMNTIRMAVLGVIGMHWREQFEFYHEYLWQGIFIIFVIGFWIFWKEKMIRSLPKPSSPAPDAPAGSAS